MQTRGFVFDFNGTLFFDTRYHDQAWRVISREIRGEPLSDQELLKYVKGRTNTDIVRYIMGEAADAAAVRYWGERKETLYREICHRDKEQLQLAPGAAEVLDRLKAQEIPTAIATSSVQLNVEFFFDVFALKRWFQWGKNVVFDDGSIAGKPDPALFLQAFRMLGSDPRQTTVFEDSKAGITAARRAGAGTIIAVMGDNAGLGADDLPPVDHVIDDFSQLHSAIGVF